jgi:hypothetical protein
VPLDSTRPHFHWRGRHDTLQLCLAHKPTFLRVLHSADVYLSVNSSVQLSIHPSIHLSI